MYAPSDAGIRHKPMPKKKNTPKVVIEAPLSSEELKAVIQTGKAVVRKDSFPFEVSDDDNKWENPEFSYVGLDSIGFRFDEILVDTTGKETKLPGGIWMYFNWTAKGIGFGQFRLTKRLDDKLEIDTEGCGKEFFARALCALVNQAEDVNDRRVRRMSTAKKAKKQENQSKVH